ncbi:MAG TPA: MFS transporter [Clostridiales bacterium]|nr:MFS transporter [Clostridiales bacterium]
MKLNYKRTILVGFAFFLISAFWQAYDTIVPLLLKGKYGINEEAVSGFIMSLDNILAVVLLPLFGSLSDRTSTRFGRRTPYIVCGTVAAAVMFSILGIIGELWLFIILLLVTLLSMATFRSPAVALMPDVTPKPLRSKANAVINLMGTAGGMIVLGLGIVFHTNEEGKTDFTAYLCAVAVVMALALLVFLLTVKEKAWSAEAEAADRSAATPDEKTTTEKHALSKGEKASLGLILASVALWYIGYNAVTSKFTVYTSYVLDGLPYQVALLTAQAAAIVAFIPVGLIASKVGRKRTILTGVALLAAAFLAASFITTDTPAFLMYILFALAGIGWATINVNSFPMVVELASHGDVGKYTGYYYTASMAAQIVTPILSGFLVDLVGWWIFFPYAAFFVACSFVTMLLTRHGDSRPEKKSALESFDIED